MITPSNSLQSALMSRAPQSSPPSQANGIWAQPPTPPPGPPGMPPGAPSGPQAGPPPLPPPGAPTGAPTPPPSMPPPAPLQSALTPPMPSMHTQVPPEAQRAANYQQMQQAYQNGGNPNPVLLRALLGRA